MSQQPTLFDPPERAKIKAIAQVERNNKEFVDVAYQIIERIIYLQPTVTALDIWRRLPKSLPRPTNPRAMGPVFMRARHAGLISPTNSWVPSGRTSDHNQMLRVWASNVYAR